MYVVQEVQQAEQRRAAAGQTGVAGVLASWTTEVAGVLGSWATAGSIIGSVLGGVPVLLATMYTALVYVGLVWGLLGRHVARGLLLNSAFVVAGAVLMRLCYSLIVCTPGAGPESFHWGISLPDFLKVLSLGLDRVSKYEPASNLTTLLEATTLAWVSQALGPYTLYAAAAVVCGTSLALLEFVLASTQPDVPRMQQLQTLLLNLQAVMSLGGCGLVVWVRAGLPCLLEMANLLLFVAALSVGLKLHSVYMPQWAAAAARRLRECDDSASAAPVVWRACVAFHMLTVWRWYGGSMLVFLVNCVCGVHLLGFADMLTPRLPCWTAR